MLVRELLHAPEQGYHSAAFVDDGRPSMMATSGGPVLELGEALLRQVAAYGLRRSRESVRATMSAPSARCWSKPFRSGVRPRCTTGVMRFD